MCHSVGCGSGRTLIGEGRRTGPVRGRRLMNGHASQGAPTQPHRGDGGGAHAADRAQQEGGWHGADGAQHD
jgi:hypothetical protein